MSLERRGSVGVAVRPAVPADVPALVALENAAFASDRLDRRALRHAVRSPTILALVAADPGGRVLGYCLVQIRRGSGLGWLTSVAVSGDARGRGVGRSLVEAAEGAARAAGRGRVRLEVRADNEAARTLYERAGYRLCGTEPDYYEDGAAALRFEKGLG